MTETDSLAAPQVSARIFDREKARWRRTSLQLKLSMVFGF
jgi:hypothetical protein